MPEIISPEVECLKLKAAINENHRLAQKAAADAVQRALLAGEHLCKWKEMLSHGKFEVFVEKHFEGSLRTAQRYMTAVKGLRSLPKSASVSLLSTEDTLSGLLVRLKKDDSASEKRLARRLADQGVRYVSDNDSISEKGRPGGAQPSSHSTLVSAAPEPGEAADSSVCQNCGDTFHAGKLSCARCGCLRGKDERTDSTGTEPKETDPRPPRSGKDKPGMVEVRFVFGEGSYPEKPPKDTPEDEIESRQVPLSETYVKNGKRFHDMICGHGTTITLPAYEKSGKPDYGKCPNCAGTKWDNDEFGITGVTCAKCGQFHGEPVGDRTEGEDRAGILRSKTIKTAEALMRCFDDLNLLCPKAGSHKQAIDLCKSLLKSAQSWK